MGAAKLLNGQDTVNHSCVCQVLSADDVIQRLSVTYKTVTLKMARLLGVFTFEKMESYFFTMSIAMLQKIC